MTPTSTTTTMITRSRSAGGGARTRYPEPNLPGNARQNLDLLQIAAEVAGFTRPHPPRCAGSRGALKTIWDVYSEFYAWVDPEESDDDDEDDDL